MFNLKYFFLLIPIMIFYFFEALIVALPFSLVWNFFLSDIFDLNFNLKFFDWVLIIWMFKVLFFDVFKLNQNVYNNNNDNINDN